MPLKVAGHEPENVCGEVVLAEGELSLWRLVVPIAVVGAIGTRTLSPVFAKCLYRRMYCLEALVEAVLVRLFLSEVVAGT